MQELIKDFLLESYENLDRLDRDFITLEKCPTDRETLSSIFRTIHTIKGTCGFLGFSKLESVTHVGESLLSRLRDGELTLSAEMTSGMLALVDAVRQILRSIEGNGLEGNADYSALIATLTRLKDGTPAEPAIKGLDIDLALVGSVAPTDEVDMTGLEEEAAHTAPATFAAPEAPVVDGVQVGARAVLVAAAPVHAEVANLAVVETKAVAAAEPEGAKNSVADSAIRVDVNLLDKLMNLVGELVLARNQILQHANASQNVALYATTQRLNLITTELQEGVMKTRMQPINLIWQKFPRIVRDLSTLCGKKIRLEMEGKETELDKTIVEAIKDPLTHIVRNSVDHGVESPEKRAAAGKPEEGRLFLRAFHEGGQVNIEIVDDGGGINPEKVKAKAVDKGLITPEQAARMGEREAINLIFLPGFSTAEKITNVSGRGVGMDVVKTNIEKIGGTVDVSSRHGEGTTLRIRIPLTLAIVPALLITSGGERFAVPQVSLLELVRLEPDQAKLHIEAVHGAPVYRLRGNLLPLAYLNKELGLKPASADAPVNIVVLQADGRQFGLVVDQINDTEEIVVKPLGKQLKGISTFAGATIMGDGRVALIIDVMGMARAANVIATTREVQRQGVGADTSARAAGVDKKTLLLFRVGQRRRMAVSLSDVARLEEFSLDKVEQSGQGEVVQYRGEIMPLVRLQAFFPDIGSTGETEEKAEGSSAVAHGSLQVVVYSSGQQTVGLVVDAILDTVEEALVIDARRASHGLLGSAVLQGKVTELLDVRAVVEARDGGQHTAAAARAA